jgi:hypothetical protein
MRVSIIGAVLAGVLAVTVSAVPVGAAGRPTGTAAASVTAAAAPYCGITWGSMPKSSVATRTGKLVRVTTSRQSCWDRTTFEFDGPVDGYVAHYAAQIYSEGGDNTDLVPYTAGGAHLRVLLLSDAGPISARAGQHHANVLPYRTLRDVVNGNWFEDHAVMAVGVRARLPFRVLKIDGPGTHSRLVIDVAHQW